jgi:O-antigen/teichoic acid export membrane protein
MSIVVKRVFLNTFSGYINFFFSALVLYLLTPYILEHVGSTVFGLWSLIFSVIGFFQLLDMGFYSGVVKFVAQSKAHNNQNKCNRILSTTFFVYLFLSLIGCIGLTIVGYFFNDFFNIPPDLSTTAYILLILLSLRYIVIALPLAIFTGLLVGELYNYVINFTSVILTVLYSIAAWYFLAQGYSIITLGVLNLISVILEYTVYIIISFWLFPWLRLSLKLADFSQFRELLSFTSMQFVANLSGVVIAQAGPIIVKLFYSLEEVALYAIALRVLNYVYRFVKQFTGVLTPIIAHYHATKENDKIVAIFLNCTKYALVPATLFLVGGLVFSYDIIDIWIGDQFSYTAYLMIIMLITMWLSTIQIISVDIIAMSQMQHLLGKYFSYTIVIYLVACIVLTYFVGVSGVAYGSVVTALIGLFFWIRDVCHFCNVSYATFIKSTVVPVVIAGALDFVITYFIRFSITPHNMIMVFVLGIPGALAFLVLFWFLFLEPSEKGLIKKHLLPNRLAKRT